MAGVKLDEFRYAVNMAAQCASGAEAISKILGIRTPAGRHNVTEDEDIQFVLGFLFYCSGAYAKARKYAQYCKDDAEFDLAVLKDAIGVVELCLSAKVGDKSDDQRRERRGRKKDPEIVDLSDLDGSFWNRFSPGGSKKRKDEAGRTEVFVLGGGKK